MCPGTCSVPMEETFCYIWILLVLLWKHDNLESHLCKICWIMPISRWSKKFGNGFSGLKGDKTFITNIFVIHYHFRFKTVHVMKSFSGIHHVSFELSPWSHGDKLLAKLNATTMTLFSPGDCGTVLPASVMKITLPVRKWKLGQQCTPIQPYHCVLVDDIWSNFFQRMSTLTGSESCIEYSPLSKS